MEVVMKTILLGICVLLVSGMVGCATYVRPLTPANPSSIRSYFRNTAEVIVVMPCQRRDRFVGNDDWITIVEDVYTGERFNVRGCVGQVNDRFRLSYY
jgi:uncharacterized membrane protein